MRIEVGYGLEGTLTDATSSLIIANAVAPRFKAGDFDGGVARGVDDIITVLTTDSADWQKKPELRAEDDASLSRRDLAVSRPAVHPVRLLYHHAPSAAAAASSATSSCCRPAWAAAAAPSAAAVSAAAAAFPAAADRRAAAAPRGVGDAGRSAPRRRISRRPSAPRSSARARRSSACWRALRPITNSRRCCGAACVGLITPWPLLVFTQLSAQRIFIAQLAVCFAAMAILSLTAAAQPADAPRRAARQCASRRAGAVLASRARPRRRAQRRARLCLAGRALRARRRRRSGLAGDRRRANGRGSSTRSSPIYANAAPPRRWRTRPARCADLLEPAFPPAGDAAPQHRQHFHVV